MAMAMVKYCYEDRGKACHLYYYEKFFFLHQKKQMSEPHSMTQKTNDTTTSQHKVLRKPPVLAPGYIIPALDDSCRSYCDYE